MLNEPSVSDLFRHSRLKTQYSPVALRQLAEVEQSMYTHLMFFVYAIYNRKHEKIYIGQTFDLEKRIEEHNEHLFKGFTSRFDGSWEIIYTEEHLTRVEALTREKQLKSYRGREFVKQHIPKV